jgi:signal transduction histidine kinase/integral membrane sensor domain MASE1/CheY-like chemotaxis protein
VATTLAIATGNALEALLAVWAVNRFANGAKTFERARNIFKFVLLAPILSTTVSATFGVTSLTLGGFAPWDRYAAVWLTWWLGDAVGALIVAPLVVIWLTEPYPRWKINRLMEAAGLLLTLILVTYLMFLLGTPVSSEYMMVLPLLWAAFRFGQRGAVTSAFIMAGIALVGTLHGVGPFAHVDPNDSLLHLQAFMGTVAVAALVLASVNSEAKRAEQRLQVQDAVSRILAESPTVKEATSKVIQVLCERAGWDLGAVWNMDRVDNELGHVDVWHRPSIQTPRFESATKGGKLASGTGLPGRVWSTGKASWISDVTVDANFRRASLASEDGLHGAFAFPIKLGDKILGVIECFSREVREPDDNFLQMVADIGGQLGQFIDRKRADELLGQAKDELLKANEDLERKVQERTADLKQVNAELQRTFDEQKQLEEQLRQAQKMESIGTLAGGIAHDFNNILNIIRGYASLIGRQPSTGPETNESLQVIDREIERGASVVRQLLSVARKTESRLARADVNNIVLTLSELIKTFPKTITVAWELEPGLPPVLADANQMSRALLNICVNARDAMPAGGRLSIRTEMIEANKVREQRLDSNADARVCIVISDTGIGMAEEVRGRIFEPFFTTKGIGEGTGLGLAIVYSVVKEHNGFIEVESAAAQGTTFRLYLPALTTQGDLPVDETVRGNKSETMRASGRGTVLVVEDEEALVRLLKMLLPQAGYRVLAAMDGEEAIALFYNHTAEIDIVLLDLGLPKITGLDVIPKLKERNPRVKIVITTGYLQPELKAELFRAGVKDCIHKPYLINHIIERLGSLLKNSSTLAD